MIDPRETVIVVCNASASQESRAGTAQQAMPLLVGGRPLIGEGQTLQLANPPTVTAPIAPVWKDGRPEVVITVPRQSCQIYKVGSAR